MFTHTAHFVTDPDCEDLGRFESVRCTRIIPPGEIERVIRSKFPAAELVSISIQDSRTGDGRIFFPNGTFVEPLCPGDSAQSW